MSAFDIIIATKLVFIPNLWIHGAQKALTPRVPFFGPVAPIHDGVGASINHEYCREGFAEYGCNVTVGTVGCAYHHVFFPGRCCGPVA